jgi:hypothetical protein
MCLCLVAVSQVVGLQAWLSTPSSDTLSLSPASYTTTITITSE